MGFFRGELGRGVGSLKVGETASVTRPVTKQEVLAFMGLSGDLNPLYADTSYAGRTSWGDPVVPPNLLAGLAQGAVATVLPGRGSLTVSHSYQMGEPARAGDELTVSLRVVSLDAAANRVTLAYVMKRGDGAAVLTGEMLVAPPEPLRPVVEHAYEQF